MARPFRLSSLAPALALALPFLSGCEVVERVQPVPVAEFELWEDAAGDVEDPALRELCADIWDWSLANDPFWATALGDPRFHGDLPLISQRSREKDAAELRAFRERLDDLDRDYLVALDREVIDFLTGRIDADLAYLEADVSWTADPMRGPLVQLLGAIEMQPIRTAREREMLISRLDGVVGFLREAGMNLRLGATEGRISNRAAFDKQLAQVDAFLATDPYDSPITRKAMGDGRWVPLPADGNLARVAHAEMNDSRSQRDLRLINRHLEDPTRAGGGQRVLIPASDDPLSPEERGDLLSRTLEALEVGIYPAASTYRETLAELAGRAREDSEPGLAHIRGGAAAYRLLIGYHTSLPDRESDAGAIHEFGLNEVARVRAEIAEIGGRVFGTRDVAEIQRRLRTDPAMHFETADEIVAKADSSLRRAEAGLRGWFNLRHGARCVIREIPAHEAPNSTVGYYEAPEAGGGRPGTYFVNTSAPTTRTRYEAEVLAFHEAVPGHHLQIALAQERDGLPLLMRHAGWTAFVEGWALYTERLADEMGLYSGDVDRLGMLSFDAWRASRLVVDTGLHAFGWSRDQAIRYLNENTLLAPNNVVNEVDRYIAMPGQALAYKIGQREILDLRTEAKEALGSRFNIAEFHDEVLSRGALPLSTLRTHVRAWVRANGGAVPIEAGSGTDR